MSRLLRIEYPGAWNHVMNRGRRADDVSTVKKDYQCFVDLLQETSEMWGIRIAAHCLMPNHYHLLIQAPLAWPTYREACGMWTASIPSIKFIEREE